MNFGNEVAGNGESMGNDYFLVQAGPMDILVPAVDSEMALKVAKDMRDNEKTYAKAFGSYEGEYSLGQLDEETRDYHLATGLPTEAIMWGYHEDITVPGPVRNRDFSTDAFDEKIMLHELKRQHKIQQFGSALVSLLHIKVVDELDSEAIPEELVTV